MTTCVDQTPALFRLYSDSEEMVDAFGKWDIYGIIPENTFDLKTEDMSALPT